MKRYRLKKDIVIARHAGLEDEIIETHELNSGMILTPRKCEFGKYVGKSNKIRVVYELNYVENNPEYFELITNEDKHD